ncbi:MAG: hypothetical protein ACI9YO_001458 [Gammaproteobacteria bacterium]|jgi:hypothetical protein
MNIIQKYWHGHYPLAISFWIFFIALGIVFHLVGFTLLKQLSGTSSEQITAIIIYQVTGGLILYPWQTIGLLRSVELYFKQFGGPVILHTVQAVILVSLILLASHFVGLVQTFSIDRSFEKFISKAEPPKYSIQLTSNERQLIIRGTLDFGITETVSLLLKTHSGIKQVMLESEGGQIYEGRGLAVLFNLHGLDTYSDSYCLSSCTTAFIGGAKRYLGENARLGFHQYAFDSKHLQPFQGFYNLDAEQNKDLELYRSKDIEEDFIQNIFHKPNHEIWYPSRKTLLKAGVVTEILYQNVRPKISVTN